MLNTVAIKKEKKKVNIDPLELESWSAHGNSESAGV